MKYGNCTNLAVKKEIDLIQYSSIKIKVDTFTCLPTHSLQIYLVLCVCPSLIAVYDLSVIIIKYTK